jgi:sugar O-acyltransferase (sialic acid O-acetyltransferase NeuD family)
MKDIAIFGAGGLGREILLLLRQLNEVSPTWNVIGFFDEKPFSGLLDGLPFLGSVPELNAYSKNIELVIGVGNCGFKQKILARIQNKNIAFPVLIHPSVKLRDYQYCEVGEGSVICESTIITTNVKIGKHVLISPGCSLAHDVQIADGCSLMYRVNLAGNVKLHANVYLGTNSTVIQLLEVGAGTIIGAGAVVTRSLPACCTAVGVPAKIIKTHEIPA